MPIKDADTTCTRCKGRGSLPQFAHVQNGVCFRCWGSGEDPHSVEQLRTWLAQARSEYRARLQALQDNPPPEAEASLKRDLAAIARLGKKNRARLEQLTRTSRRVTSSDRPSISPK